MSLAIQAMVDGDVDLAMAMTETAEADANAALLYIRYAALLAEGEPVEARRVRDAASLTHVLSQLVVEGIDAARMARDPAYALSVARQLYIDQRMAAAVIALNCALNAPHVTADVLHFRGQAEHYLGRPEEAVATFRRLLNVHPAPYVHSFIANNLFFVEDNVRRQAEEAKAFNDRWTPSCRPLRKPLANPLATDRKLRIGYLGPTYTVGLMKSFLHPLLENHDLEKVEVFAYVLDAAKEKPIPGVTVRHTEGMSYPDTADLIRSDRIDVLVDHHGHYERGRPLVAACRAAPVQVSWMGWNQTTGIESMDYVIHCDQMDPPDAALPMPETPFGIGPVMSAYRPDARAQASTAPAIERGYVTFASFNHPGKLSDQTIAAWSKILTRAPTAKLHLKYHGFGDAPLQLEIMARFLAHGVSPEALEYSGYVTGEAYEAAFASIDIALDTSPYPGGTTSLDALARGVPLITLNGENFYTQLGVTLMVPLGFPELVASDWDDYIDKAVAYANDIPAVAALRERIKPAFDASPFRDEVGFARRMEAAYSQMFAAWAARQAEGQVA
jgi:predicted O-linked N-acetylglucosamine transferase (SPINDLY family)